MVYKSFYFGKKETTTKENETNVSDEISEGSSGEGDFRGSLKGVTGIGKLLVMVISTFCSIIG